MKKILMVTGLLLTSLDVSANLPEAPAMDRTGRPMGTHYGGPTWKAPDGSLVVAEVRARAPAADKATYYFYTEN